MAIGTKLKLLEHKAFLENQKIRLRNVEKVKKFEKKTGVVSEFISLVRVGRYRMASNVKFEHEGITADQVADHDDEKIHVHCDIGFTKVLPNGCIISRKRRSLWQ